MRLSKLIVLFGILLAFAGSALGAGGDSVEVVKTSIGKFELSSKVLLSENLDSGAAPTYTRHSVYVGPNFHTVTVDNYEFSQDAHAYEMLSLICAAMRKSKSNVEIVNGIGTAGFATENEIAFFKGRNFVRIRNLGERPVDLSAFANVWAESLDKGEGDIPVLIKHLPSPEDAQKNAVYLNSFADLHRLPFQHAVYVAVQSDRNADAVLAAYGPSKLLILEFHTPQLATENDKRIVARIQELWKLGQPAPTAYQRVGNYSVLVFDAPDEQTAKRLIGEVKYEQQVQWLGENPYIYKEAQKQYVNTTLGVLVAVLKASGYALVACLGLGGLIGGLLFTYRRTQQKAVTFSDAGGMLRLNLDDLTAAQTDPARLLRDRN